MKLTTVIEYLKAEADIKPALHNVEVTQFVIDSREVRAGDVFFALSQPEYKNNGFNGDFDDATAFAVGAFEKGAVACVLRRDRFEEHRNELEQYKDRLLFVDDVIYALQQLAHAVYAEWNKPVVAVTGSAGKTTTKELTAAVLEAGGHKVLRNIKNYNNGLGHPLTVLNLASDNSYDIAVLEMGMSTPMNEIARLCRITPPDVAIELNVLPVHVEHLGSIENVAAAKAELVEGMKPGGTAVLNYDDERTRAMAKLSKGKVLTYGLSPKADIRAINIENKGFGRVYFTLSTPEGDSDVNFPLNGKHNILNALAAAAAGICFEMSVESIATALNSVKPPPQRGELLRFKAGFDVINDSYNSNPDALLSMVTTVKESAAEGNRTIIAAGEMLELGKEAGSIHFETGKKIAETEVDLLLGIRGLARELVDGAKAAGLNAVFNEDSERAGEYLASMVQAGDLILVKGSRGVRTEKIVEKLLEKFELEEAE